MQILSAMHNMGLLNEERAMTAEEIANRTGLPVEVVRKRIKELSEMGYVKKVEREGTELYYLSPEGILRVLSLYT